MLTTPTVTPSPCSTVNVTGTGSAGASSGWAITMAPVAAATSCRACQWSPCWWVVTILLMGMPPMSSSSRSASAAASISSPSPVSLQRTR